MFKIRSKFGNARRGTLETFSGNIETPFFMPIATKGAVKGLDTLDLKNIGSQIVLSNTYHLWLRPGDKIIKSVKYREQKTKSCGLHVFMNWDGPILSDSGGYQVFSLAKIRKVTDKGVEFRSPIDGEKKFLTPEKAISIQNNLGVDIMMVLDECVGQPSTKNKAGEAVERTTQWAKRCLAQHSKLKKDKSLVFGIVQGSSHKDLRIKSAKEITSLPFDGIAIGGVAVGESESEMFKQIDYCIDLLPKSKPRYLMGVGFPEQILKAVSMGIDMFDCVIPTRFARHGILFKGTNNKEQTIKIRLALGRKTIKASDLYELVKIGNKKYQSMSQPINKNCDCYACRNYSLAYLRHLYMTKDPLYIRLATIHNLKFYLDFMGKVRNAI